MQPVRRDLGDVAVQDLTRRQIDVDREVACRQSGAIRRSCARGLERALVQLHARCARRFSRSWSPKGDWPEMLPDWSIGCRVRSKNSRHSLHQVRTVLGGIAKDRNLHAWHLAHAGLRRGEIAGLRWDDFDLGRRTVRIGKTRVDVGGRALDQTIRRRRQLAECYLYPTRCWASSPRKSAAQAAEKLSLGEAYAGLDYVVCNEAGEPYHPSTLSTMWQGAIKNLAVRPVRLHDARHTCATLMHLQGVPIGLFRPGLAMLTCLSLSAPTYMLSLRPSNWRRAALLRRHPALATTDAFAQAYSNTD